VAFSHEDSLILLLFHAVPELISTNLFYLLTHEFPAEPQVEVPVVKLLLKLLIRKNLGYFVGY